MKMIKKGNKILCKTEVSKNLKIKIDKLLNKLMNDYSIEGKSEDFENVFKYIFKSNLIILIDNEYHSKELKVKKND